MSIGCQRGLTLIEVAVAVAILGITAALAASVFVQATRVQTTSKRDDAARVLVESEIEGLRALSFWAEPQGGLAAVRSLVGIVFPHAIAARNTVSCYYVERATGAEPAGAFVSTRIVADRTLKIVAQFMVSSRDGWRTLDCDETEGFSCDEAERPPSTTLLVAVSCSALATQGSRMLYEQHAMIAAPSGLTAWPRPASVAIARELRW